MYQRLELACACLLFVAIVILVGVAAVARYVGAPIIWSIEVAQLLFVWLCLLAADLALQQQRHFGLSILIDNIAPRWRQILAIVNHSILLVLLAFLLFHAVRNTQLMHSRFIGATRMNASLVHAAMPFGLALMIRTLAVQLYQTLMTRERP